MGTQVQSPGASGPLLKQKEFLWELDPTKSDGRGAYKSALQTLLPHGSLAKSGIHRDKQFC